MRKGGTAEGLHKDREILPVLVLVGKQPTARRIVREPRESVRLRE